MCVLMHLYRTNRLYLIGHVHIGDWEFIGNVYSYCIILLRGDCRGEVCIVEWDTFNCIFTIEVLKSMSPRYLTVNAQEIV